MDQGFIKLWRKSIKSPIFKNINIWHFWCYCLLKATHKKRTVMVGNIQIDLIPGQFVFGRDKAAEESGLTSQNVRTCIKVLKKSKNLTIKSTNRFSIISIINWDIYQPLKIISNQQINQQVTSSQPASNQQPTTDKNVKNVKNVKNTKKTIQKKFLKNYLQKKILENSFIEIKDKIYEFFNWRMTEKIKGKKQPYESEKGIDGLFRNMNGCRKSGLIVSDCLDIAMERPWLTPDPSYYKSNKKKYMSRSDQNKQACIDAKNELEAENGTKRF